MNKHIVGINNLYPSKAVYRVKMIKVKHIPKFNHLIFPIS